MTSYFKRHRRRVIAKALKGQDPIFVLANGDVIPQLVGGRL